MYIMYNFCSAEDCKTAEEFMHNRDERLSDSIVSNYKCLNNMTVEVVDRCLNNMRKGKACVPDNLCAEHLIYARSSVAVHLRRRLFMLILQHGFFPNSFGSGVSIPLVKDKTDSLNNMDNYRGITLSPIISELFEMTVLEICNEVLTTDSPSLVSKQALAVHMLFSL